MFDLCNAKFEVNGKEVFERFESLFINQPFGQHNTFKIHLPLDILDSADASNLLSFYKKFIGKELKITVDHRKQDSNANCLFIGIITRIEVRKAVNNTRNVLVSGFSKTILLEEGDHIRSFSQMELKDIVEIVRSEYSDSRLNLSNTPKAKNNKAYTVQYRESNFAFLRRMASRFGEWLFYDGKELHFGWDQKEKAFDLWLETHLDHFELDVQVQPTGTKQVTYDLLNNQINDSQTLSFNPDNLDSLTNIISQASDSLFPDSKVAYYPSRNESQKQLDEKIKRLKGNMMTGMVVLKSQGKYLGLKPGSLIKIHSHSALGGKEEKEYIGEFTVLDISHSLDNNGNYNNVFKAIPSALVYPGIYENLTLPQCKPQPARVKENTDPEGLGRIRVQFPWQSENEMTPWISCTTLMGGKDNGIYIIPEIDELVFVAFEDDNPDYPFVLGSLYHGDAKPGFNDPENNQKVFKTRGGNLISMNDASGKETIRISNMDSQNEILLTVEEGGQVCIKTNGKIKFSAESIEMNAKTIEIKAQEKLKLESQEIKAKADMKASIESTEISLDAKAKASIKSKASVEISATAEAKVNAGLIRLN